VRVIAMPAITKPTTATTGPITAQTESPDMKLPPITPNPCNAQITPATVKTAPTAVSIPFRTMPSVTSISLVMFLGQPCRRECRRKQHNTP